MGRVKMSRGRVATGVGWGPGVPGFLMWSPGLPALAVSVARYSNMIQKHASLSKIFSI